MCTYFLQGVSCKVLSLCMKKIGFPTVIRFQIDFITHTLLLLVWRHMKFVYSLEHQVLLDFEKFFLFSEVNMLSKVHSLNAEQVFN